ncbi:uncharacterized [Tachysurus ichikawai]
MVFVWTSAKVEVDAGREQELALCGVCEPDIGDADGAPPSCRLHEASLKLDVLLAPASELYPAVTSSVLLRSIYTSSD